MAQKVVTTCDACGDDAPDRPGVPTLLRVDDTQAIVDLCEEHRSVFVQPVAELLEQYGRPEARTTNVSRSVGGGAATGNAHRAVPTYQAPPTRSKMPGGLAYPCPVCVDRPAFGSGAGLNSHVQTIHDVKPSDYSAWLQAKCRACDYRADSPQGLARHIQTQHHQPNSAALVAHLALHDPEKVAGIVNALVRGSIRRNRGGPTHELDQTTTADV